MNTNIKTGNGYEGKNQVDLMTQVKKAGYKSTKWGTFLQWKEKNRKIIKGEHGISIFKGFGTFGEIDKKGKTKTESRPLGFARIFNYDQTTK